MLFAGMCAMRSRRVVLSALLCGVCWFSSAGCADQAESSAGGGAGDGADGQDGAGGDPQQQGGLTGDDGSPGASSAGNSGPTGGDAAGDGATSGTSSDSGAGAAGHGGAGADGAAGGDAASGGDGSAGGDGDGGGAIDDSDLDNGTQVDMVGNANRAPGFIDLSPPMGEPLAMDGDPVMPAAPAGFQWYAIDGAMCRDGSPAGFYLRRGSSPQLVIYLEGGGACSNDHYCAFNPASVDQVLAGDGQVVLGSALGAGPGRQQPGAYTDGSHAGAPAGIFDTQNAQNPFKDWSQIYIPYCTGDVHFGTNPSGMVPNLPTPQKFVGYRNMQRFIGRIVPTFKDTVSQVVITGASAGGFGAALNFSMVQDAFGDVPVKVVDDSGPPFDDQYMPPCMQKRWREAWGFNDSLPPDCDECRQSDGAGLVHLSDFLLRKHPNASIALISSMQDEVIRLFYSVGLQNCANYDTADPVAEVLLQGDPTVFFPAQQYTDGLNALRSSYQDTGRFSTYYIGGANITFHQHIFRQRFYESVAGGKSIAQFVSDFLDGTIEQVGP